MDISMVPELMLYLIRGADITSEEYDSTKQNNR